MKNMERLIQQLINDGYLQTPRIIEAFKAVDRRDFVPGDLEEAAYINEPLTIGFGQTISQPLTVAFMLELLQPQPGDKVLDVGAGSGWQAALVAYIVGLKGKVYAIEIIPQLKEFGEQNAKRAGFKNIEFICADGSKGLPKQAHFNRIIGAASAPEIPPALLEQLKKGGRLVFPVQDALVLAEKKSDGAIIQTVFPGFRFVPLV